MHDCANRILRVCPGLCCTLRTLYLHARCASRLVRDPPRKRGRKATAMALPAPAAGVKLAVFKGTIPVVFANITVLLSLGLATFPAVSSINVAPKEQGAPCARGCNWLSAGCGKSPPQNKQNKTDRDLDHRSFKLGRKWLPWPRSRVSGFGEQQRATPRARHVSFFLVHELAWLRRQPGRRMHRESRCLPPMTQIGARQSTATSTSHNDASTKSWRGLV